MLSNVLKEHIHQTGSCFGWMLNWTYQSSSLLQFITNPVLGNNLNPDEGSHAGRKQQIGQLNPRSYGIAIGPLVIMLTATTELWIQPNGQKLTKLRHSAVDLFFLETLQFKAGLQKKSIPIKQLFQKSRCLLQQQIISYTVWHHWPPMTRVGHTP